MRTVNTPYKRVTPVIDPDTGKNIVFGVDPPGVMLWTRSKSEKQSYPIHVLDVHMAAKALHLQANRPDLKTIANPPTLMKKHREEPDIPELIKEVLGEKEKLHFSQVRQQLRLKGVDIKRNVMGSLLKLMTQTKQVEHDDRMYYSLRKAS